VGCGATCIGWSPLFFGYTSKWEKREFGKLYAGGYLV
jgi:hypothetical protein